MRGKPTNDAVMRALSEVEQTLTRLKQARAERTEAEARYRAELAERDERERALAASRDEAAAALAEARGRLQALEQELERVRSADRAELESLTAEQEQALAARAALVERLGILETELSRAREQREGLEAALAQAEHDRAELIREQEAEREQTLAAQAELAERLTHLETELSRAREQREGLEASLAHAQGERAELIRVQDAERERAHASLAEAAERLAGLELELSRGHEQREGLEAALAQAESERAELLRLQDAERDLQVKLGEAAQRVASLESEVAGSGSESERLRHEAQVAAAELETLRARVGSLEVELQTLRDQAAQEAERHAAESARYESQVGVLESELQRLRTEFEAVSLDAAAKAAEAAEWADNAEILGAKVSEQAARISDLEASLAGAQANLAAHAMGEESAGARIGELSAELDRAHAEIGRLKSECEAAIAAGAEAQRAAEAGASQRLAELETTRRELESKLAETAGDLEELRRGGTADASLQAELEALREQFREVAAQRDLLELSSREAAALLEARQDDIESLREKLDFAAEKLLELQQAVCDRDEQLAAGGADGAEIVRLRNELSSANARLAAAQSAPKGRGRAAASPEAAARLSLRRRRLARVRRALRDRRAQTERASSLLADRVKLCDELLARRRELAEAREVVERTHRKVVSERARSSSAAVVFFGAGLITVLAAASWTVVSHFFPATYAATAVLAADFRGVTPAPEEPGAWQEFHQQLLGDPQLLGRVAERMRQRGFEELGAAATVKAMLDRDLSWASPEPGKLVLELQGIGKEATARKLDVYATTLEVEANALRQRRSDSAQTVIAERAHPGNEPVLDDRPMRAAIGLGVAAAVALLVWTGIWRRMVKTKQAFENPERIDHLLEEARWVDPIQKIIEAGTDGPRVEDRAA
jgi:chromosome segregation ATPase